jgi:NhaP-type Na+/H+ or K+/H+ antiporter
VRVPRHVSPAAARRRSLLVDVVLGLLLALAAIVVAAGIGVVGFFALLCALALVPWYLLEGRIGRARRRPPRVGRSSRRPGDGGRARRR